MILTFPQLKHFSLKIKFYKFRNTLARMDCFVICITGLNRPNTRKYRDVDGNKTGVLRADPNAHTACKHATTCSICMILQRYSVTNINITFYTKIKVSINTTAKRTVVQDVQMYESHISEHKVVKYGNLTVYMEFSYMLIKMT
jgi:hypothetical protein